MPGEAKGPKKPIFGRNWNFTCSPILHFETPLYILLALNLKQEKVNKKNKVQMNLTLLSIRSPCYHAFCLWNVTQ